MDFSTVRALICTALAIIGFLGLALSQDSKKPGPGIAMTLFSLIVLAAIAARV